MDPKLTQLLYYTDCKWKVHFKKFIKKRSINKNLLVVKPKGLEKVMYFASPAKSHYMDPQVNDMIQESLRYANISFKKKKRKKKWSKKK